MLCSRRSSGVTGHAARAATIRKKSELSLAGRHSVAVPLGFEVAVLRLRQLHECTAHGSSQRLPRALVGPVRHDDHEGEHLAAAPAARSWLSIRAAIASTIAGTNGGLAGAPRMKEEEGADVAGRRRRRHAEQKRPYRVDGGRTPPPPPKSKRSASKAAVGTPPASRRRAPLRPAARGLREHAEGARSKPAPPLSAAAPPCFARLRLRALPAAPAAAWRRAAFEVRPLHSTATPSQTRRTSGEWRARGRHGLERHHAPPACPRATRPARTPPRGARTSRALSPAPRPRLS